jgi:hypothetical protein
MVAEKIGECQAALQRCSVRRMAGPRLQTSQGLLFSPPRCAERRIAPSYTWSRGVSACAVFLDG